MSVSGVAAISIQGIVAVFVYEYVVDEDIFLWTLQHNILPLMNPFPGPRSVLIMDNSYVHKKALIFLPPYSYDYNPIELAVKAPKAVKARGVWNFVQAS